MTLSQQEIEKRTVYYVRVGSHAYGISISEAEAKERGVKPSDEDFIRVIYERPEDLILASHQIKTKNTKDPDETIYTAREFVRLASKGNPNILETLWSDPHEDMLLVADPFADLITWRQAFVSKTLYAPYRGYATQQYHRYMENDQSERKGVRREVIDRFGFDTKAAVHILRLCYQGASALLTGDIPTRLPEKQAYLLKAIRLGYLNSADWVTALIKEAFDALDRAYENSTLPDQPNRRLIEKLLLHIHEQVWNRSCVEEGKGLVLRTREGL